MNEQIIIAGSGGQGIMLLGKILAAAAMNQRKYVTWLPSYGAEVRGGTAFCMVIISDEEIGSPYITKSDSLIAMNEISLEKFRPRLKNKGVLIVNTSLANRQLNVNQPMAQCSFTDIAMKLGNIKVANMVALGCYLAKKKVLEINGVLDTIEDIAPQNKKNLVEINKKAVIAGSSLIK